MSFKIKKNGTWQDITVKYSEQLKNAQDISITGGATASAVSFNGTSPVALNITGFDFSKVSSSNILGTLPLSAIPQGAQEKLVIVADQTALLALTSSNVQLGDTVKVTSGFTDGSITYPDGQMFFVVDETKLADGTSTSKGIGAFTAYSTTSYWKDIYGKPTTISGYGITDVEAYEKLTAGGITVQGTNTTGITFAAGNHITLTPDATNHKLTITADITDATDYHVTATTFTEATANEPKLTITQPGLDDIVSSIPLADATHSGFVSQTTQTFAGNKTFSSNTTTAGLTLTGTTDILPTTASSNDIGSTALPFANVYSDNLTSTSEITKTITVKNSSGNNAITIDGTSTVPSIYPTTTNTGSIGSSTNVFANGYFTNLTVGGKSLTDIYMPLSGGTFTGDVTFASGKSILAAGTNNIGTSAKPFVDIYGTTLHGNWDNANGTFTTPRNFSITGGATASAVSFNGSSNVALNVTGFNFDGMTVQGVLPLSAIPQGAQERLVVLADKAALLAVSSNDVQVGDVLKVTSAMTLNGVTYGANSLFYIKDASIFTGTATETAVAGAIEVYNTGLTSWNNVTDKPTTIAGYGITDTKTYTTLTVGTTSVSGTTDKGITLAGSGGITLTTGTNSITVGIDSAQINDTKVTQKVATDNTTYPVLLAYTANATADITANTVKFYSGLKVNPSTGNITTGGSIVSDTAITDNLGSQAIPFNNIYSQNVIVRSGTAENLSDVMTIDGVNNKITPATTNTGSIGDATHYWNAGYFTTQNDKQINLLNSAGTSTVVFDGTATVPSIYPATTNTGSIGTATKLFADIYATNIHGSLANNLAIALNGGTTEGTNLFTYNGSSAKNVNITPTAIGTQYVYVESFDPGSTGDTSNLGTSAVDNSVWITY